MGSVPTPLYVTQQGKGVLLKFSTQEEADLAWRILSAMANAHAERTHEQQLECMHDYAHVYLKGIHRTKCVKCGHVKIDADILKQYP
jgi:hypothetical protein